MKAQTRLLSPRKLRQETNFILSGIAFTMITIVGLLVATTIV